MTQEEQERVGELADDLAGLLIGHDQLIQGVALASVLATWLACHPLHLRGGLLELHISAVHEMVETSPNGGDHATRK